MTKYHFKWKEIHSYSVVANTEREALEILNKMLENGECDDTFETQLEPELYNIVR